MLAFKEGESTVEFIDVGDSQIPVLRDVGILTPGEIELAHDFDYLFHLCSLVDSVEGATLPEDGGWNNQHPEFVDAWLIYKSEKNRAESNLIKRATSKTS